MKKNQNALVKPQNTRAALLARHLLGGENVSSPEDEAERSVRRIIEAVEKNRVTKRKRKRSKPSVENRRLEPQWPLHSSSRSSH